jgi:hypothetical protein
MLKRIIHQFKIGFIKTVVLFILALLFSVSMYYLALFSVKLYIVAIVVIILICCYFNGESL